MKQISKVFISVGLGIMFLCGMLDADGEKYILLLIAMALGALVALMGVAIMDVEQTREKKRKEKQKAYFIHQKDKLDADVEFLVEFEDKKIAP